MASIEIKGLDKLVRKLGATQGRNALRPPMQRSVERLRAALAKYPPQRAGARYRRTGTLGRRWTTKVTASGSNQFQSRLTGIVGNNTYYAQQVQSREYQARWHRGVWQTEGDVAEQERAAIVADFEQEIERLLR